MTTHSGDKTNNSAYAASVVFVEGVDRHLKHGTRHYRQRSDNQLLRTLPEVCVALESFNLAVLNPDSLGTSNIKISISTYS